MSEDTRYDNYYVTRRLHLNMSSFKLPKKISSSRWLKLEGWLYAVFIFYDIVIEEVPIYWQFERGDAFLLAILFTYFVNNYAGCWLKFYFMFHTPLTWRAGRLHHVILLVQCSLSQARCGVSVAVFKINTHKFNHDNKLPFLRELCIVIPRLQARIHFQIFDSAC